MDKVEYKTKVKTNSGLDFEEPRQPLKQSPPVAEGNETTANKGCEEVGKKLSHCLSVSAVVATLVCIWIFFMIPQLCYFNVRICTDQITNEVSCLTAEFITYLKQCIVCIALTFLLYLFFDWLSV